MARPWILVVPHPDDETLAAGVPIAEHVAAGRDVHILLLTRGTNTGVIRQLNGAQVGSWWGMPHTPAVEGYAPLSQDDIGNARYAELVAALGCLGVTPDRIHEASDLIGEPVVDSSVTVDQAKRAIIALADTMNPAAGNVGLWTPSDVVDVNPDHLAAGIASRQLGAVDPVRWADRRYYVLPPYWDDPRLPGLGAMWDVPNASGSASAAEISLRARNACRAYGAWHPPHSYAIGYHSVASMFAAVDASPRCRIHK